jgi:hypothetical protein
VTTANVASLKQATEGGKRDFIFFGQIIIFIYKILTESFPLYLTDICSLCLVVGLARLKPSPAYPIGLRIKKAKAKEKYFSCWALVSRLLFILLTC